jgi:hypothetical protein
MKEQRKVLVFSGIVAAIVLAMGSFEPYKLCGEAWLKCLDYNYQIGITLMPVIPFFAFSLITYFLRKEVFATWIKFAAPWAVVSMLLVALAPTYGAGGQFAMPDLSYTKDMAVFLTTAVAVVVSLLIVVIRSIWLKAQSK